MSVVPVAVAAVVGLVANARTVRLAWSEESHDHRKILLVILLLSELAYLVVPGLHRVSGDDSDEFRTVVNSNGFLTLVVFLGILNFQEFVTLIFSFSKSWSIHADLKSAGLIPAEAGLHRDSVFKTPLLLIAIGSLLAVVIPVIGLVLIVVGLIGFVRTVHTLSKSFPENEVLANVSVAWILRIVLKVLQYFVAIPLAFRLVSDAQVDEDGDLVGFAQFVERAEDFLSTFPGALLVGLLLGYKLVVLTSTGFHFMQRKNRYWIQNHHVPAPVHVQQYNYPVAPAGGFQRLPGASVEEGSISASAGAAPVAAVQTPAPAAPQGYAFYM